ncbi:MAG: urea ABC transporter permease subunit UrtC [Phenylobacterium sp.]|uniref:urea ABC transporter permease subunit UrtC n=1 Tax=Phenylobacterium sp. TaxID=1871053 RepID=UPI0027372652|nr:urea ABC transporter permease subunit UrtC [Phenylobacterium sp.]MDP3175238.1 urea ABC transporter permease subunit UrtC [Phenylobacterium sp.]
MSSSMLIKAVGCALLVLLAAAAPTYLSSYDLSLTGRFLALSLTAMGLVLIWGQGGILSLGQGVFFGLGGYVLAMHLKLVGLETGEVMPDFMVWSGVKALPWWWEVFRNPLVMILGVLIVPALVAAAFGWLVFRRRIGGVYFALITQALALAFATLLISQQAMTGGFNGLTNYKTLFGFNLNDEAVSHGLYWATLAIVVVALICGTLLLNSSFGKILRATRDNTNRVRFLGYDPTPYKIVTFSIAAMFAGLSGALFALHAGVISPALIGVVPSIEMVIWAAVGGRTSLIGAVAGALLVNFAKDKISTELPAFWLYMLGGMFILVVTVLPKGLAGMFPEGGFKMPTLPGRAAKALS